VSETDSTLGILVAVDGSRASNAAVEWAAAEAVMRHLPLTLMHVVPHVVVSWPVRYLEADFKAAQETHAREVLADAQAIVTKCAAATPPPVQTRVERGNVAAVLVGASHDAFMTVVGSRGLTAVGRAILGSVSSGLAHYGHGPIVIVREESPATDLPVLVGIDGSPASEAATAFAFEEASRRGVDLVALHVWSDVAVLGADWRQFEQEAQMLLGERLAGWQERYPDVKVHRRLECDRPAHWLIEESARSQLVVIGNRGRGGFTGMVLGSVGVKVAQAAQAPTVIVRPR